jgi:phage host-nuclease inhibitor protein Gam
MNKEELLKPAIASWRELDEKLGEYAAMQNELERVSTKINARIQGLKAAMQEETADLEAKIRTCEQVMNIFVMGRLDEIRQERKKSMVLSNGTVKTKTDEVLVYPDDEDLIQTLKRLKLLDCIKTTESPIRALIKAKAIEKPELLDKLGIEKDEDTKITYKIA